MQAPPQRLSVLACPIRPAPFQVLALRLRAPCKGVILKNKKHFRVDIWGCQRGRFLIGILFVPGYFLRALIGFYMVPGVRAAACRLCVFVKKADRLFPCISRGWCGALASVCSRALSQAHGACTMLARTEGVRKIGYVVGLRAVPHATDNPMECQAARRLLDT